MSRRPRAISEGDIYHVTARGVAQQSIFEGSTDREFLLGVIGDAAAHFEVELYAWCFMSNHIHLLVHAPLERIASFMNSSLSQYARFFNKRTGRTGSLFENRFHSCAIDTDEYLMTAVRYIHFNPKGAGVLDLKRYYWSSYREYLGVPEICQTEFVLGVFGGLSEFACFHETPNDDQERYRLDFEFCSAEEKNSDDAAIAIAKQLLGIRSLATIAQADKATRNNMIVLLKTKLSVRQISRITGISRSVVQRTQ